MHPQLFLIGKLKEIGGIELEPWLTRPFCHALKNMYAGQQV